MARRPRRWLARAPGPSWTPACWRCANPPAPRSRPWASGRRSACRARWSRAGSCRPPAATSAAEAGVRLLAGTDSGVVPHGAIRGEIGRLIEAGVPPSTAVGAGSWDARAFLGFPGIEAGAPADVVAFHRDPREGPGVLAEPALIVLDGRVVDASRALTGSEPS